MKGKGTLVLASDTDAYKAAVELFNKILDIIPSIPHDSKFTIGEQMQTLAVRVLVGIQRGYMIKEERLRYQRGVIADINVLSTLIRTAGERRWIGRNKHADLAELTRNIGKQVTTWKNSPMRGTTPQGGERSQNPGGQALTGASSFH